MACVQVVSYVAETDRLKSVCSKNKFADYSLGFVRYLSLSLADSKVTVYTLTHTLTITCLFLL